MYENPIGPWVDLTSLFKFKAAVIFNLFDGGSRSSKPRYVMKFAQKSRSLSFVNRFKIYFFFFARRG